MVTQCIKMNQTLIKYILLATFSGYTQGKHGLFMYGEEKCPFPIIFIHITLIYPKCNLSFKK